MPFCVQHQLQRVLKIKDTVTKAILFRTNHVCAPNGIIMVFYLFEWGKPNTLKYNLTTKYSRTIWRELLIMFSSCYVTKICVMGFQCIVRVYFEVFVW